MYRSESLISKRVSTHARLRASIVSLYRWVSRSVVELEGSVVQSKNGSRYGSMDLSINSVRPPPERQLGSSGAGGRLLVVLGLILLLLLRVAGRRQSTHGPVGQLLLLAPLNNDGLCVRDSEDLPYTADSPLPVAPIAPTGRTSRRNLPLAFTTASSPSPIPLSLTCWTSMHSPRRARW